MISTPSYSPEVNDLLRDSADIWIGSTDGVLQIPEFSNHTTYPPPVYITSFKCADTSFSKLDTLQLKYFQNNIEIEFIGISFNHASKVLYKYIFNTAPHDTIYTHNNTLSFYGLAAGTYTFKVWARNPEGLWSTQPAVAHFEIALPFWKSNWFLLSITAIAIVLLSTFIYWWLNRIRKREKEKMAISKKITEVELQAVRAHMNEHFIFNSLNSIQSYINDNDIDSANFYLVSFGTLIRKTMEISAHPLISLKEEIEYLNNYLILEKMRFGNKFTYSIVNTISSVPQEEVNFPSMILQPYVENAVKHGLRNKTTGQGLLEISFSLEQEFIVCTIKDNGIGRKRAAAIKKQSHFHYQSKGLQLSNDKVYLFNQINNSKIHVEITDLENEGQEGTGTLVKVFVPLNDML